MADFITAEQRADLVKLYIAYFNRAPEADGLNFHAAKLLADINSGMSPAQALTARADAFYTDALTLGAWTGYTAAMTAEDFVKKVYANVLLRPGEGGDAPSASDIAYWVNELATGSVTRGSIITQFLADQKVLAEHGTAEEKAATAKVMAVLDARLEVALEFSKMEISGELRGEAAHDAGVAALAGVKDAATAAAKIAELAGQVNAGDTYTLTKSVQVTEGTSGNDTFIAGDDGGTASLNAGDVINGGAGTDTLKIFNAVGVTNGANFTTATISGVENVEFTSAATTQALNVSGNADVTKVTLVNGLDAVVTANLTQTVGLKGNINTNAAATSFVFTSVAGAADSANVVLDGASTAAGAADNGLTLQDVETLNLALTGTNVVGKFDSDATKLVITGAGSLKTVLTETTGTASLVKTIDASAATGALDIDNKSFAGALETITLGSGDDRYVTKFANMDALDKIDLGAGTNDILAFADATDLSTTTKAAVLAGAKNYEAIEVTGGAFAMKVDGDALTGIKSFIADTTGALTATNIYSGTKVTVGDVALAASTVGMKLGEKVLDVALAGTKTAVSDASAGIAVTGATDINVSSNGFADVADNKLALKSDDNTTIKISGAKDLILTTTAATGTTGFTIDGSAATGKLTLTGTGAVDIIKGGSGADTLNKSVGVDTFTGNGGADKFVVITAAASDADTTVGTIAVTAIITDFTTGSDTLSGFGTAASSANYVEATAAAATLTAFKAAADAALDGTVKYYVGQVGSDSYVAVDADGTGFTDLIKLTGVSLDGIALTDIVA